MRVAVILTGELRNIDYCYQWWKSVVKMCNHEVDFYSCTWGHLNNAFFDSVRKTELENLTIQCKSPSTALSRIYSDVQYLVVDDTELHQMQIPSSLREYCTSGYNPGMPYFFGRVYHMQRAVSYWNTLLQQYDVIVHSRWDTAFRNTNYFNYFVEQAQTDIVFRDIGVKQGLIYSCDWAYAGPAELMIKHYINPIPSHIKVYEHFYNKNQNTAYTFLIGHNIHSTYLQHQLSTIKNIDFDCTLVRTHDMQFEYTDNQWQKMLQNFIKTTTSPVDN